MPLTGAAAARVFDDHVDAIHAMVVRRVGPADGARITEEVFEQAATSWDRFDPDDGTERNFLLGMATVVIRRHPDLERSHLLGLRPPSRRRTSISDPLVAPRSPDDDHADAAGSSGDEVGATMRAVAQMEPDDRDILLLSTWEGCQNAAIADALDLAVGTVRSRLGRLRRELKSTVAADRGRAAVDTTDGHDARSDRATAHDSNGSGTPDSATPDSGARDSDAHDSDSRDHSGETERASR